MYHDCLKILFIQLNTESRSIWHLNTPGLDLKVMFQNVTLQKRQFCKLLLLIPLDLNIQPLLQGIQDSILLVSLEILDACGMIAPFLPHLQGIGLPGQLYCTGAPWVQSTVDKDHAVAARGDPLVDVLHWFRVEYRLCPLGRTEGKGRFQRSGEQAIERRCVLGVPWPVWHRLPPESDTLYAITFVHIFEAAPGGMTVQEGDIATVRLVTPHVVSSLGPVREVIRRYPPVRVFDHCIQNKFHGPVRSGLDRCLDKASDVIREFAARITCSEDSSTAGVGFHEITVTGHTIVLLSFLIPGRFGRVQARSKEVVGLAIPPVRILIRIRLIGKATK
jgi:hypothetical protein